MLETAVTSCIGVISKRCPKLIVASSTGPHLSSAIKILFASPGSLTPVFAKNKW